MNTTQKTIVVESNEFSINIESNEKTNPLNDSSLIDEIDNHVVNQSCILNLYNYNIPMVNISECITSTFNFSGIYDQFQ